MRATLDSKEGTLAIPSNARTGESSAAVKAGGIVDDALVFLDMSFHGGGDSATIKRDAN